MNLEVEENACNFCDSKLRQNLFTVRDFWLNTPQLYNVVKCVDCGLVYLNPRPKPSEFNKLYPTYFYNTEIDDEKIKIRYNSKYNNIKASYLSNSTPGNLFEIGAYWGDFLKLMESKNWNVSGCELSTYPRNVFNLNIERKPFEQMNLISNSMRAIVAWAVLEHVYNPLDLCREVFRVLEPGGEFVFTVPNFNSLGAKYLWADDFPRHVFFFTPESLQILASKIGFKIDKIWFDSKLFSMGALGIIEFNLRKILKLNFEKYLIEKRSYDELKRRSSLTLKEKMKEAGIFWTAIRIVDHLLAPILDFISKKIKLYGIMTVRMIKPISSKK